jgi:cytoskeletal protein CcmA (bactofilin family)
LLVFVGIAYAATNDSSVQGITNKTIYKVGNNIDITGTVNGDIYCAAQTVNIDAQVNGDVICVAQTITVNGKVLGNVRVAGQTVNIGASVMNNVSVAGQTLVLQNNSFISRDALIAGQSVSMDGKVGRDVTLASNTATISSSIGRDVKAKISSEFILTSKAKIGGTVDYTSPSSWNKSPGSQVSGTINYHKTKPTKTSWVGWNILWRVYWLVVITVLAVILVALFPQIFRKWSKESNKHLGYILLTGFLAMFAVPILILVSFISVVGVPLGILLLLFWIIIALLSIPTASYLVGVRVAPNIHPVLSVIVGSLILGIVGAIPIFGWLVSFLAYLIGTGTLLWNLKKAYNRPNYGTKASS